MLVLLNCGLFGNRTSCSSDGPPVYFVAGLFLGLDCDDKYLNVHLQQSFKKWEMRDITSIRSPDESRSLVGGKNYSSAFAYVLLWFGVFVFLVVIWR